MRAVCKTNHGVEIFISFEFHDFLEGRIFPICRRTNSGVKQVESRA
jgi:hypothetical protein